MSNSVTVVCFGAYGDILNSTPIAKHYKMEGKDVTWVTKRKYSSCIDNNPYIDQIFYFKKDIENQFDYVYMTFSCMEHPLFNTPSSMSISKILPNSKVIFSAPYASPYADGSPRSTLLNIIKDECSGIKEWNCDFIPIVRLASTEEKEAIKFYSKLQGNKKILIEYEFHSAQSMWDKEYLIETCKYLNNKDVDIILTGKNELPYLEELKTQFDINFYHYHGSFMSNAKLYNLVDMFIGVSSGITCLTSSDYCDTNKERIEVIKGPHWGTADWKHNQENKTICYNFDEYCRALDKTKEVLKSA